MADSRGMIKDIMTGIFLLAVVGLLVFFTVIISGVDLIKGRYMKTCNICFTDVGTLKAQDPVYVRGLKVGSVQSLNLIPGAVMVKIAVDSTVTLREDYAITIGKTSMLGGTCLQITEGASPTLLPEGTPLTGLPPVDVMADLGELVKELRDAVDPQNLESAVTNIQTISADLAVITHRVREGEGTIGKLLSEDSSLYEDLTANLANLKVITEEIRTGKGLLGKLINEDDSTYEALKTAVANINETTENLKAGKGLLGKLINEEDTTYGELKATMANLNAVTTDIKEGKGLLGKLLKEDDTTYNDLKVALVNIRQVTEKLNDPNSGFGRLLAEESTLIADLESSAENIRLITEKLEKGDGTLGKLVNDDQVAVELESAIKDVRQIIDNMRDTAPITTFSSLFFSGL
jgi:phospholipid/cholesterol/gamma-HCH transport system substrate-binding protein